MNGMTAKRKIAVSLPAHLVEAAKRAVRAGRAPNVSAYVAEALDDRTKNDDLRALLDEMRAEADLGPMTDAARRWADEILEGSDPRA